MSSTKRLHINDRAYIRKVFKLLRELNNSKALSTDQKTEIYSLREQYKLLHLNTCTRDNLIVTYHLFARYFESKKNKSKGRLRFIDFNQGVDARLFDERITALLSEIPIRPLRIAFDDIKTETAYTHALTMSVKHGIKDFSNYLLYNFKDKPVELYHRMRINVDLCEQLDVNIYSFPMKYHPIRNEHSHDRDYIGEHWNRKYIRAVQAILNATKGKIGRGKTFFEKAFGKNEDEYLELLMMPETFLLYRFFFEYLGKTQEWRGLMNNLSQKEKKELYPIIFTNDFNNIEALTDNSKYLKILSYYKNFRGDIIDPKSELYRLKKEYDSKVNRQ